MLVLSRRPQQSLFIGPDIVITVLDVNGDNVRIGISAPPEVDIHREEITKENPRSGLVAGEGTGSHRTRSPRPRRAGPGRS